MRKRSSKITPIAPAIRLVAAALKSKLPPGTVDEIRSLGREIDQITRQHPKLKISDPLCTKRNHLAWKRDELVRQIFEALLLAAEGARRNAPEPEQFDLLWRALAHLNPGLGLDRRELDELLTAIS